MISISEIDVDDFKSWFTRDFQYLIPAGETEPISDCERDYVSDRDITKAMTEAACNFNPALFSTDDQLKTTFLYLVAHYLVNDMQTAGEGLESVGYFTVNSRSVGGVSESYSVPDWMIKDPNLGWFSTTRYGQKYLSLIKPLLIGNVGVYEGGTTFR